MDEINSLPADTHIGSVQLKVSDLRESLSFYTNVLGFQGIPPEQLAGFESEERSFKTYLSANGNLPALIVLAQQPGAIPMPRNTTGLYHVAIRVPDQAALGTEFERVRQNGWRFQGAADHQVSEALPLTDPDGNGLEIYTDRAREDWPRSGNQIVMATDPLDVYSLMRAASLKGASYAGIHPETVIGHVHLQVADLSRSEDFYHGLLGFDVTQRSYPGALFVSAGGYHHHIGLNVWAGEGAPPPPPNAVGLKSYTIVIPDGVAWQSVLERLQNAGVPVEGLHSEHGFIKALVKDPSQNGIELAVATGLLPEEVLKKLEEGIEHSE